jgi:hypothetical protein
MNCLLVKLKDKRKFLTSKNNLDQLIEFANTFKAELSLVETNCKNIKSLEELANDICDTNCKQEDFDYKEIEKIAKKKSNKIFEQMIKDLKSKKTIDISKIKCEFSKQGLEEKEISAQIQKAKNYIKKIGFTLNKIDKNKYKIN